MMRLTPLSLAANTIFYLILAVMYCRVLTRRFSWPFTLLGLTVGYLLYIIPTKFMPYADAERMLFGLVTFPLTPIVLFRDKWYKSLLCAFAGLVAMAGSDLLSVSWLLTPEQLRQGLTFQPIPARGYTVLLSTHNPEHALHYAHRVLALQDGHIAADGPTETALTPQLLQTLYGIQAILAEVPTDRGTVRSLIVTEDME